MKEKLEKKNVILPIDHSSPITVHNSSENILNNSQISTPDFTDIHEDISQNNDDNQDTFNQENNNVDADTSIPETANPGTPELCKAPSLEEKKKVEPKLEFLQMRIDSTIYFDNMGYSYQIQNEKNDKK